MDVVVEGVPFFSADENRVAIVAIVACNALDQVRIRNETGNQEAHIGSKSEGRGVGRRLMIWMGQDREYIETSALDPQTMWAPRAPFFLDRQRPYMALGKYCMSLRGQVLGILFHCPKGSRLLSAQPTYNHIHPLHFCPRFLSLRSCPSLIRHCGEIQQRRNCC
jgi:hypothetical protein